MRKRDLIWDQMEVLFGTVVSGTNAHARRNKAVKDLKLLGAEPEDLPRALASFNAAFPRACCTDIALATHFPQFRPRHIDPPCPECGMSPPMHAADCSRALR
ncbi:MAG TPA: hypothetical protein VGF24_37250 [Vicinamibacterales bacterium]